MKTNLLCLMLCFFFNGKILFASSAASEASAASARAEGQKKIHGKVMLKGKAWQFDEDFEFLKDCFLTHDEDFADHDSHEIQIMYMERKINNTQEAIEATEEQGFTYFTAVSKRTSASAASSRAGRSKTYKLAIRATGSTTSKRLYAVTFDGTFESLIAAVCELPEFLHTNPKHIIIRASDYDVTNTEELMLAFRSWNLAHFSAFEWDQPIRPLDRTVSSRDQARESAASDLDQKSQVTVHGEGSSQLVIFDGTLEGLKRSVIEQMPKFSEACEEDLVFRSWGRFINKTEDLAYVEVDDLSVTDVKRTRPKSKRRFRARGRR